LFNKATCFILFALKGPIPYNGRSTITNIHAAQWGEKYFCIAVNDNRVIIFGALVYFLGCFAFILAFISLFSLGDGGSWTGHLIPVKTCGK
jgi:hypothetical protein